MLFDGINLERRNLVKILTGLIARVVRCCRKTVGVAAIAFASPINKPTISHVYPELQAQATLSSFEVDLRVRFHSLGAGSRLSILQAGSVALCSAWLSRQL